MQLLDPFKNIIDPDLLSREPFVWLEEIGDWVGVYFTTPENDLPKLLGTIEDRGWVVNHPIRLECEVANRPPVKARKQITKITMGIPKDGELKAYLEDDRYKNKFTLFLTDGCDKARVVHIETTSLESACVIGNLRTGDGDEMIAMGIAVDHNHFLKVCRD